MAITGLELKVSSAISDLSGGDHNFHEIGIVVRDLASAVEQLSQDLDKLKKDVLDLEDEANRQLEEEVEQR